MKHIGRFQDGQCELSTWVSRIKQAIQATVTEGFHIITMASRIEQLL